MFSFNTYGNVQLQLAPRDFTEYHVGDQVPLADGIYCGNEGFIAVANGKFVLETQTMTSTHGKTLFPEHALRGSNPFLPSDAREEG